MDSLSVIILLLMAFLAWSSKVEWLFLVLLLLVIIVSKSKLIAFLIITGVGFIYFFRLTDYFFLFFLVIAGVILFMGAKKKAIGTENYSPELMRLLGGY